MTDYTITQEKFSQKSEEIRKEIVQYFETKKYDPLPTCSAMLGIISDVHIVSGLKPDQFKEILDAAQDYFNATYNEKNVAQ